MKITAWQALGATFVAAAVMYHTAALSGNDRPTRFSNKDSINNTRHNMTQSTMNNAPTGPAKMDDYRNDYGQVCVYCHTPHAANTSAAAPLWNRTLPDANGFTKYSALGTSTLSSAVVNPGASSLTCLSCHDGQTSIDAIINMPGSGGIAPGGVPTTEFLDGWNNPSGGIASHGNMTECMACHSPFGSPTGTLNSPNATDFTVFRIGTDLRNDHPIGVQFPGGDPDSTGFQSGALSQTQPNGKVVVYYDKDGSGKLSKQDPRFYDNKVECASCHDPHGVPSAGPGSTFFPTFLRVSTTGSTICLTCHAK